MTVELAAIGLGAYLLGSIPSGYLLGLLYRIDVRDQGSGNIGATNVARSVGRSAGILTLLIDMAKGATPVLLVDAAVPLASPDPEHALRARVLAAVAAVAGHIFSVFLRFRGGKGVATTFGALAALMPPVALAAGVAFGVVLGAARIVSVASLVAALVAPLGAAALGYPRLAIGAAGLMALLIVFRHHENLARLRAGTEPRLGANTNDSSL